MKIFLLIAAIYVLSISTVLSRFSAEDSNGQKVFKENCASCHTGGFKGWITGAPEIGYPDEWEPYFEKDFEVLVKNVNEGTEGHEVKGGCDTCPEESIKSAVKYILSETKNKK